MMPPYGPPYAAFYAHGGVYAHPGVPLVSQLSLYLSVSEWNGLILQCFIVEFMGCSFLVENGCTAFLVENVCTESGELPEIFHQ